MKRGRPIGSKNKNLQKRKSADKHDDSNMKEYVPVKTQNKTNQEIKKPWGIENHEISIDYVNTGGLSKWGEKYGWNIFSTP